MGTQLKKLHFKYRGWLAGLLVIACMSLSEGVRLDFKLLLSCVMLYVGVVWRIWARQSIGVHSRGEVWAVPILSTDGAYAKCRHPLYISAWWIGAAWILAQNMPTPLLKYLFVLLWSVHLLLLAKSEDQFLCTQLGPKWMAYAESTEFWSWWPGFPKLNLRESLSKDLWTWVWITLVFGLSLLVGELF